MGYTAGGAYPKINDVKQLGSSHSPWPGPQSDAGRLPSLLAGTHLQLSRLKQSEAKSYVKRHTMQGFDLRSIGSSANTLTDRLHARLKTICYPISIMFFSTFQIAELKL